MARTLELLTTKPHRQTFRIEEEPRGALHALVVYGELDLASSPRLADGVFSAIAAGHRNIEIDLHEVTFIDSTGLAVLIGARRSLGAEGQSLVLTGISDELMSVFRFSGLQSFFDLA
jgi:anti-sigma B factor antagonist